MIYVGLRLFDALSFARGVDTSLIITCDGAGCAHRVRSEYGVEVRSLEDVAGYAKKWSGEDRDAFAEPLLEARARSDPGATVVTYSPSHLYDRLYAQGELDVLNSPARLSRLFDNKRISKRLFRALDMPTADYLEGPLSDELLRSAFEELGSPIVLRLAFGSTGFRTFLCASAGQARAELTRAGEAFGQRVLIERFEPGVPLNLNVVAFHDGEAVYEPSIQIIGPPACTDLPFGFCGSDHHVSRELPREVVQRFGDYARRVSAVMRRKGYLGIFGLDVILTPDGRLLGCEINPRMQNSTALLNWMCEDPAQTPAALHVAALRGARAPVRDVVRARAEPLTQVIAYADDDRPAAASFTEGRYALTPDGEMRFIDELAQPRSLRDGEALVHGGPPEPGFPYRRGGVLFRLILRRAAVDPVTGALAEDLSRFAARLKSRLLEPDPAMAGQVSAAAMFSEPPRAQRAHPVSE